MRVSAYHRTRLHLIETLAAFTACKMGSAAQALLGTQEQKRAERARAQRSEAERAAWGVWGFTPKEDYRLGAGGRECRKVRKCGRARHKRGRTGVEPGPQLATRQTL